MEKKQHETESTNLILKRDTTKNMTPKIFVAVVCDTLSEAKEIIREIAPDATEIKGIEYAVKTSALRIDWVPTNSKKFLGCRFNCVYAHKETVKSEWFNEEIDPCIISPIKYL